MNKEDILLLDNYFNNDTDVEVSEDELKKLCNKIQLIVEQINYQDRIIEINNKLDELNKKND